MTKYDPYKGLKPTRRRTSSMTSTARSRWGIIAASAVGIYYYNKQNRGAARSGGSYGGTPSSVELTQDSGVGTLNVDNMNVQPSATVNSDMVLSTSPLNVQVNLTKQETGHTVNVYPYVGGQSLSITKLSTTDANGVASVTFSAEDMNIIKNEGTSSTTSVIFRIVVDGAYADSVNVVCPIGA